MTKNTTKTDDSLLSLQNFKYSYYKTGTTHLLPKPVNESLQGVTKGILILVVLLALGAANQWLAGETQEAMAMAELHDQAIKETYREAR